MHVLGHRGRRDLRRCQPDALIDHLEAGVAGPHGDLLGAVGVAVQPGLADQQPQPAAEFGRGLIHFAAQDHQLLRGDGGPDEPETPVGARNSPKTPRRTPVHSPVVTPARAHASVASIRLASVAAS